VVATVATVAVTTFAASLDDAPVPVDEATATATATAIDAGIAAAQGWAAFAIAAWVAGTVLWWAPWFRGGGTAESVMPDDAVHDLEPGSLVHATPAAASLAGESPDEVAEGTVERERVPHVR